MELTRYGHFIRVRNDAVRRMVESQRSAIDALRPLQVGGKIQYRYDGAGQVARDGTWYYTVSVDRAEKVTVPAGTFDTLVVSILEEGGRSHKAKSVQWYAPSIAVSVKFVYENPGGTNSNPPPNTELVAMTRRTAP